MLHLLEEEGNIPDEWLNYYFKKLSLIHYQIVFTLG
jgi:hypothetical protein